MTTVSFTNTGREIGYIVGLYQNDNTKTYHVDSVVVHTDTKFTGIISVRIHDQIESHEFTTDDFVLGNDHAWKYETSITTLTHNVSPDVAQFVDYPMNITYAMDSTCTLKILNNAPAKFKMDVIMSDVV